MRVLADTNILLRFLLKDHTIHSPQAIVLFERAAGGTLQLVVPTFILAECVFTLQSYFKVSRTEIASSLDALLSLPGVRPMEADFAREALRLYAAHAVDFADALLAAMSADLSSPVVTFDKDFKKLGTDTLPLVK